MRERDGEKRESGRERELERERERERERGIERVRERERERGNSFENREMIRNVLFCVCVFWFFFFSLYNIA